MKLSYILFVMVLPILLLACQDQAATTQSERQVIVAERGAEVMPFDLERTTHIFEPIENGGLQQVISDDSDESQIALIRSHLAEEAIKFNKGNFHDPEMIHGENMAGLHELVMGHDRIAIEYTEIEQGGQILYTTDDPKLVAAIHSWFDAQVSDHGSHAQSHQ